MIRRRPGRPPAVEHGTERREFAYLGIRGDIPRPRYCTVAWMFAHGLLSATATYRDPNHDLAYLGMAHGRIDGEYYRRGDTRAHGALALTGRDPQRRADYVEAVVNLAVQSLEATVAEAVCGPAPDEGEHPWTGEDLETFKGRLAGARRKQGVKP